MTSMNMIQALNSAMDCLLDRDPNVVIMGEDVGYFGGVFRATAGLQQKYGRQRVFDTPIAEGGIVATAIGMGVNGLRPIAEIQFSDYIYPAIDQIVSEAARLRYRSGGEYYAPITIRSPCGGGIFGGQTHSQSPEGIFTHVSGLTTVMPSNPYDAKGLLIAAVDLTVITYGTMVHVSRAAVERSGFDAEIIDLRTLVPLDIETITKSVHKTGRCVVVHEATRTGGFGAEILSQIQEDCFWDLEAPIERVTGWDTPYPHAFEWEYFPGQERVLTAIEKVMGA